MPPPPGGYIPPGAGYAAQRTDGLAIAALVIVGLILGVVGFVASVGWFFFVIVSGALNNPGATPSP